MDYDKTKYEVAENMPEKFAYMLPGHGIHHFIKKFLSDNDCEALLRARCSYINRVEKKKEKDTTKEDDQELLK